MTPAPSRSQRAFTVVGFLAVAALTAGAFVLSYDALRLLALAGLEGRNADRFGRYYPVVYDGLVAVALLAVFVARHSPWWVRWVRWLVLFALVAGGIWASVQHAVRGFGPIEGTALEAGVASAPWVAALLAIWLWMSMFRQLRPDAPQRHRRPGRRRASRARRTEEAPVPVPALTEERPEEDRPEHQTDPLPLPAFDQIPEPYREAAAGPAPEEPRREPALDSEEPAAPEPDDGPWDSPWPDGVRAEERDERTDGPDEGEDEKPAEPARPPLILPTDVKLVGRREEPAQEEKSPADPSATTQPDFPVPGRRAQHDPAGDDDWAAYSAEYDPPSGVFRSGPVPPEGA